jgi:uncharacterized repeat protein (TIGR01451 family)
MQLGSTPDPDQSCSANSTLVQDTTASDSPSYAVPAGGGVITKWSYLAKASPGARRLKLLRPTTTSGQYVVAGQSELVTPRPNELNTFGARVPVAGGELLGIFTETGDGCRASGPSGNVIRGGSGDPPPGSTFSAGSLFASSTLLDVSAVLEADADGDGYGDETQDGCPTDRTVYATPCSADVEVTMTAGPSGVRLGETVSYTIDVRNHGPTAAHDLVVTDELPARAPLVSAPKNCTGFRTLTCTMGALAPGASAPTMTIVIRAPDAGELSNTVTAASPTLDPAAGNNSATASLVVAPPVFSGVSVGGGGARVVRNRVPVRVACPIAARTCAGELSLVTTRRVRLTRRGRARVVTLGGAPIVLAGGQRRTLQVPLTGGGRTAVARLARVAATATALTVDAFGQVASRRANVTVLQARRSRR